MRVNTETKVLIGVLALTVLIVVGGAFLASSRTSSKVAPTDERLVRQGDPAVGPTDAKVTVVEFSDFECPACAEVQSVMKGLHDKYKDKSVRFVFRQYPLPSHANASLAAEASLIANAQGKFWQYHDLLFADQTKLSRDDLIKYAEQVGLDKDDFARELDKKPFEQFIQQEKADGKALGLQGTPTVYINGVQYQGAPTVEAMSKVIDAGL